MSKPQTDEFSKSEQAYQVIGSLSSHFGAFEHPEVQRALDYFSSEEFDPNFLPWSMPAAPLNTTD